MNTIVVSESELVSFTGDPTIAELLDPTARLAESLAGHDEGRTSSPEQLAECVRQIREIGLVDLLIAGGDLFSPESMLFHVADMLGNANLTAAWEGLIGVPAATALAMSGNDGNAGEFPMAYPLMRPQAGWSLLQPLPSANGSARVWLLDGYRMIGPGEISSGSTQSELLGFPHGRSVRIDDSCRRNWPAYALSVHSHRRLISLSYALVSGLLSGALRRMVKEAYDYAKTRKSAGKPISQHQAVALRLADLALNQQGIHLYLHAAAEQGRQVRCEHGMYEINVDYVVECAARIAKDAVQVAAAHGYVEGLPFKRLFEQSRTLTSCLALMSDASDVVRNRASDDLPGSD